MSRSDIAIVTPYPAPGRATHAGASLAGYSKQIYRQFPREWRERMVIIAQKESNLQSGQEMGLVVKRVWDKGSLVYWLQILLHLVQRPYRLIHLQQEVYCYGDKFSSYFLFPLILVQRLLSRRVIVTVHAVVSSQDLDDGLIAGSLIRAPSWLVKVGLKVLYRGLALFADRIVLHNRQLEKRLRRVYCIPKEKIVVIPHPLYSFLENEVPVDVNAPSLTSSPKEITVLFFGFLAPYKGLEILVAAAEQLDLLALKLKVWVAGSVPGRYRNSSAYQGWLAGLKERAGQLGPRLIWEERFIPDEELRSYFDQADIVVVPRPRGISSSGPVMYALQAGKPFLVSSAYRGVFDEVFIYGEGPSDLAKSLVRFVKEAGFRERLSSAVWQEREKRKTKRVAGQTQHLYKQLLTTKGGKK